MLRSYIKTLMLLSTALIATRTISGQEFKTISGPEFKMNVDSPRTPRISVSSGAEALGAFPQLLSRSPELQSVQRLAVAVKNMSEVEVVALTIRWTWKDNQGMPQLLDQRTDSFFNVPAAIIKSHGSILLFPARFISEGNPGSGMSAQPPHETLRQFDGISSLSASIDCIIFKDGQRFGPDKSQTVDGIRARRRVAMEVGRAVIDAVNTRADAHAALTRYANEKGDFGDVLERRWRSRLVKAIAARRTPEALRSTALRWMTLPDLLLN